MEQGPTNINDKIQEPLPIIHKEEGLLNLIIKFLKLFIKVYGVRVIYSLLQSIRHTKKPFHITIILKSLFNLLNLRTSLFVSLLPFLYKIILKLLNSLSKFNKNSNLLTFSAAFLSAYISISFEEKSKLVTYIVLSIMVRVVHSILLILCKKLNILQNPGKLWDYIIFLLAQFAMITVGYLNPDFQPITQAFDTYANYVDKREYQEAQAMREITRIV